MARIISSLYNLRSGSEFLHPWTLGQYACNLDHHTRENDSKNASDSLQQPVKIIPQKLPVARSKSPWRL